MTGVHNLLSERALKTYAMGTQHSDLPWLWVLFLFAVYRPCRYLLKKPSERVDINYVFHN
jgi:hypothetical protein